MKKTKVFKGTWLGRKGESYNICIRGGAKGLRINIHRWLDTNEVIAKLIEGDGQTKEFKEYARIELNAPSNEEIEKAVEQLLKNV